MSTTQNFTSQMGGKSAANLNIILPDGTHTYEPFGNNITIDISRFLSSVVIDGSQPAQLVANQVGQAVTNNRLPVLLFSNNYYTLSRVSTLNTVVTYTFACVLGSGVKIITVVDTGSMVGPTTYNLEPVFVATYDSTTFAEINSSTASTIICAYTSGSTTYYMQLVRKGVGQNGTYYQFECSVFGTTRTCTIDAVDGWSEISVN